MTLSKTDTLQRVDIKTQSSCVSRFRAPVPSSSRRRGHSGILVKPDKQLCAGMRHADSCSGDSGGPLLVR